MASTDPTSSFPPPVDGSTTPYQPANENELTRSLPHPYSSTIPDSGVAWSEDKEPQTQEPPPRFRPFAFHKSGGMGRVLRAVDADLNREVAFKDIQPEFADKEFARRRLLFEAEVTGRLEHPGIVPVYGLGRDHSGRPYYAMRFIRGESLREAIRGFHALNLEAAERSLQLRRLLSRFVVVCETISYAHSRGVIHRDLKPANVMLGPFGETLVVDWGVAKRIRAEEGELTSVDVLADANAASVNKTTKVGTPAYWSPEQAESLSDQHDERTDVYGLGAILFDILTGTAPHPTGRHASTSPDPRETVSWVDEVLSGIARRALAISPHERFPTAAAVAAEIERWLADQPVAAQRAAVAALSQQAARNPGDLALAEQLARQRANLGLILGGMGRDTDAIPEFLAAAGVFSRLVTERAKPRFLADEANCHLALARAYLALGRSEEATTAQQKAAEIYRGLIAARPDEYKANYAAIMLTWAGTAPPQSADPFPTLDQSVSQPVPLAEDTTSSQEPDRSVFQLPLEPTPEPATAWPSEPGNPLPEERIDLTGGYTVVGQLARGGMGSLFLARDNALNRLVVIKALNPVAASSPSARARFLREVQITAALEHPNIVRVYTHGVRNDGQPFLVMEYLNGATLMRLVDTLGPGWSAELLEPLAQVCDGLHFAHSKGIVHRDAKPTNIIVLPTNRAVLLDWGVAKRIGTTGEAADETDSHDRSSHPEDVALTQAGAVMGTPVYMAPEQARGEANKIGPTTDVFAIGAGLFHLVTGRPALADMAAFDIISRLCSGDIPRLRDKRPDVPLQLDAICAKAMAFRPENRYTTAAALAADIRAFLAGARASIRPRRGLWSWLTGR
ncbi:MAG: serine/threonine protein kinase [Planctomycetia bacterium]|nr:serine/threonine protein kinase [Planctomycetia bacterium]